MYKSLWHVIDTHVHLTTTPSPRTYVRTYTRCSARGDVLQELRDHNLPERVELRSIWRAKPAIAPAGPLACDAVLGPPTEGPLLSLHAEILHDPALNQGPKYRAVVPAFAEVTAI